MSAVYSTKIVDRPSVFLGPFPAYTVPAGKVLSLKQMSITWGSIIVSGVDAGFIGPAGGYLHRYVWLVTQDPPPNNGGTSHAFGTWVLEAGDVLSVVASIGTVDMYASGYLLDAP